MFADEGSLLETIERLDPDLVVELSMPAREGINVARPLMGRFPGLRLIALGVHDEPTTAAHMLDAGVATFVVKRSAASDIIPATAAAAAAPSTTDRPDDARAIASLVGAFTKAFNAGDAAACAATYAADAVVVDEQGQRAVGRAAVRDQLAASFADSPGTMIAIEVDSLRFLGPETALEEGRTTITPPPGVGAPEITRFTAVYVKQGGKWLQAAVRDDLAHDIAPHDRLKELEWLVGEWVNESQDAVVSTSCAWAKGGNFIDREFVMKTEGRAVLSGTQRIGWDPLRKQFKTWIFDSEGGHSEGYFTRTGNQWVVKVEGAGSDGQPSSATNIITRLGKDRMGWQSTEKTVGGASVPGIDEFVIVRKPPEVGK